MTSEDDDEKFIHGKFDEHGNPCIEFFLRGDAHDVPGIRYSGIMDTGFSGFLQIPWTEAFRLRLPLEGTSDSILADGSVEACITALGRARLITEGSDEKVGSVHLSDSPEILIGMEFLRMFEHGLGVFRRGIVLLPDPGDT